MNETFNLLNRMSDERLNLYRLAGKQHLTVEQQQRLAEINNHLPVVWDQYRREVASSHYHTPLKDERSAA